MSVVACKVEKDRITIAADSIVVQGNTSQKTSKLVSVNGMLIGSSGLCEEMELFFLFAETNKPARCDQRAIVAFLHEFCLWRESKTSKHNLENSYIIVFDGHAFFVHQFYVREIDEFDAIGAGRDFSLAVMHLGKSVRKSIEVACELSIYCALPVIQHRVRRSSHG